MFGIKFRNKSPKIGLICRVKDEYYVKEFVAYYLSQGVDTIHILDDDSIDKSVYNDLLHHKQVKIRFEKKVIDHDLASILYKDIRREYDWIIYVDVDEFITTKKNPQKTIRQELETTFKDVDCVKVPWVMMSCNGLEKSPSSVLYTNTYRWNNDLRHENKITKDPKFACRYDHTAVKCIFKTKAFKGIFDHNPLEPLSPHTVVVRDGVYNNPSPLNPQYNELREKDIKEGYLLCYHYRIISVENCLNKLNSNIWYTNFTLEDLMSTDYNEVVDESLKLKIEKISF